MASALLATSKGCFWPISVLRERQLRVDLHRSGSAITEIGCMAHARRKFFDLHVANKSQLAEPVLHSVGGLQEVAGSAGV